MAKYVPTIAERQTILNARAGYANQPFQHYMKKFYPSMNPATYGQKNLAIWDLLVKAAIQMNIPLSAKKVPKANIPSQILQQLIKLDPRYGTSVSNVAVTANTVTTPVVSSTSQYGTPLAVRVQIKVFKSLGLTDTQIVTILSI